MEVKAESNSIRISPRKIRLVADGIRNVSVTKALQMLALLQKRAGVSIEKTLKSAIANAVNNAKLKEETLIIRSVEVTEAPAMKRFRPSTRGRVHPYKRRGSHIRIVLEGAK